MSSSCCLTYPRSSVLRVQTVLVTRHGYVYPGHELRCQSDLELLVYCYPSRLVTLSLLALFHFLRHRGISFFLFGSTFLSVLLCGGRCGTRAYGHALSDAFLMISNPHSSHPFSATFCRLPVTRLYSVRAAMPLCHPPSCNALPYLSPALEMKDPACTP